MNSHEHMVAILVPELVKLTKALGGRWAVFGRVREFVATTAARLIRLRRIKSTESFTRHHHDCKAKRQ
jgi:hypothetical protein